VSFIAFSEKTGLARLLYTPAIHRKHIALWTPEQTQRFLASTRGHKWHIAFLLMFTYGLRIGEVLGLRWADIDFEANLLHIRQQLQYERRKLRACKLKTYAGLRNLPIVPSVRAVLLE